jgi:hypothetical protein
MATALVAMLGGDTVWIGKAQRALSVYGNPHGIKNGWFAWPFNFDPVWLESCNGFEEKEG